MLWQLVVTKEKKGREGKELTRVLVLDLVPEAMVELTTCFLEGREFRWPLMVKSPRGPITDWEIALTPLTLTPPREQP